MYQACSPYPCTVMLTSCDLKADNRGLNADLNAYLNADLNADLNAYLNAEMSMHKSGTNPTLTCMQTAKVAAFTQ